MTTKEAATIEYYRDQVKNAEHNLAYHQKQLAEAEAVSAKKDMLDWGAGDRFVITGKIVYANSFGLALVRLDATGEEVQMRVGWMKPEPAAPAKLTARDCLEYLVKEAWLDRKIKRIYLHDHAGQQYHVTLQRLGETD